MLYVQPSRRGQEAGVAAMSETDLTAKAMRAAEWLKDCSPYLQEHLHRGDDQNWHLPGESLCPQASRTDRLLIAFCEDRGWQDQEAELAIPTEEEALDLCASGMAQFMDEIDPAPIQIDADGVEWQVVTETTTIGRFNVWLYTHDGQWRWDLQDINDNDAYVFSSDEMIPTRAEARRQAVEAARGMG